MPTASSLTVIFIRVWVVLKVQKGGQVSESGKGMSKKKIAGGNVAIGLLLFLLAYYVYPNNVLLAVGVGLVGLYVIFGGRE